MRRFYYFAYGSNLLTSRLKARCGSAQVIGTAKCDNYCAEFTKLSHLDGSAKVALRPADGAKAHGVLFEIDLEERNALDRHEGVGRGYDRADTLDIQLSDGSTYLATSYLGTEPKAGLRPFDWYLALVLAGAAEHSIAPDHTRMLASTPYQSDPEPKRKTRLAAIVALQHAGHLDWRTLLPGTC